jgi:hypothetical protein
MSATFPADVHAELRMLSASSGRSMNDLIVEAVRALVESQQSGIEKYVKMWLAKRKAGTAQ